MLVSPSELHLPNSYKSARDVREKFTALNSPSLLSLLLDQRRQQKRGYVIDPYWPLDRDEVHIPLATARARADRMSSLSDYVAALSTSEKMALLNSYSDMHNVSFRLTALRPAGGCRGWNDPDASEVKHLHPVTRTRKRKVSS